MTPKFTLPEWLSSRERAAEVATLLATAIARPIFNIPYAYFGAFWAGRISKSLIFRLADFSAAV